MHDPTETADPVAEEHRPHLSDSSPAGTRSDDVEQVRRYVSEWSVKYHWQTACMKAGAVQTARATRLGPVPPQLARS